MVDVKEALSPKYEKFRVFTLLVVSIALLLAFGVRFPRDAPSRPMEPLTIETYFNAGWENDSLGGYVWVLNEQNKIIVANNQNMNVDGLLNIDFVGAPCGDPHRIRISGELIETADLLIEPNQAAKVQLRLNLKEFVRVPISILVMGEGCSPGETDGRLLKVQVRQPIFRPN